MHKWPYIWEDNENRVVSHTPGLHLKPQNIFFKVVKYVIYQNISR